MGYRTVALLQNDRSSIWMDDPKLGRKIFEAASWSYPGANPPMPPSTRLFDFDYGSVIECVHADANTLVAIDGYAATHLAHDSWRRGETPHDMSVRMLKLAADKLGYRLVKKSTR